MTLEISPEDVDFISGLVLKLGHYAESYLDRYDFGMEKDLFGSHIQSTYGNLRKLISQEAQRALVLRPPGLSEGAMIENVSDTWDYSQTLRFAAGATMISQWYLKFMTEENLSRSLIAKILYKCQTGILDDLVDRGGYSYLAAKNLYHHVLSSMTDLDFDLNAFKRKLNYMMKEDQLHLFDLITSLTASFNKLIVESPNYETLFYQMEVLDERVILGQALTMLQKERDLDIRKIKKISEKFYSPSSDLKWYDRLANYVSGGTRYNLIDMCFVDEDYDFQHLDSFLTGWYYYDTVIVYLNNIVNVYQDLRNGISNLSLISMREKEVCKLKSLVGYDPHLTMQDYNAHLGRLAQLAVRAITHATKSVRDEECYYPFITIMMPVVMMAGWVGKKDSLIQEYLEAICPTVKAIAESSRMSAKAAT